MWTKKCFKNAIFKKVKNMCFKHVKTCEQHVKKMCEYVGKKKQQEITFLDSRQTQIQYKAEMQYIY